MTDFAHLIDRFVSDTKKIIEMFVQIKTTCSDFQV